MLVAPPGSVVAAIGPEAQSDPGRFRPGGAAGSGTAGEAGGRLMPKVSELKTAGQIATEELADPEIRMPGHPVAHDH